MHGAVLSVQLLQQPLENTIKKQTYGPRSGAASSLKILVVSKKQRHEYFMAIISKTTAT
jgi:hypothetical protein